MYDRYVAQREKDLLDDDELQDLIAERLDADPVFYLSNGRRARFAVEVDDGAATLKGVVRNASDRRRADILARALGASTVDNQLKIEEARGDSRPSGRRRAALAHDR
jgi:osmotically-inducible protein OsmY